MSPSAKEFNEEKHLVDLALTSATGKDALIMYLNASLERIVIKYQGNGLSKKELLDASLIHLDKALVSYNHSLHQGKAYLFRTYYIWWARQGINEALNSNRNDNEEP